MGRSSVRTKANPAAETASGFRLIDVIELRPEYGIGESGVVLVLERFRPADPATLVGQPVYIQLPGGWTLSGEIAGVRDLGATVSLLLANWPEGFPRPEVGWRVEIPTLESQPADRPGGSAHGR